MANKVIAWFVGGITTTLMIIVILLAWTAISTGLRQVSPNNPAVTQVIDNSDKAINESITWYQIIGGIGDIIFFAGLIFGVAYGVVKFLEHLDPSYAQSY